LFSAIGNPYATVGTAPIDYFISRNFQVNWATVGSPTTFVVKDQVATGEDFQLSYFLGAAPYVSG